eukprot:g2129.t1
MANFVLSTETAKVFADTVVSVSADDDFGIDAVRKNSKELSEVIGELKKFADDLAGDLDEEDRAAMRTIVSMQEISEGKLNKYVTIVQDYVKEAKDTLSSLCEMFFDDLDVEEAEDKCKELSKKYQKAMESLDDYAKNVKNICMKLEAEEHHLEDNTETRADDLGQKVKTEKMRSSELKQLEKEMNNALSVQERKEEEARWKLQQVKEENRELERIQKRAKKKKNSSSFLRGFGRHMLIGGLAVAAAPVTGGLSLLAGGAGQLGNMGKTAYDRKTSWDLNKKAKALEKEMHQHERELHRAEIEQQKKEREVENLKLQRRDSQHEIDDLRNKIKNEDKLIAKLSQFAKKIKNCNKHLNDLKKKSTTFVDNASETFQGTNLEDRITRLKKELGEARSRQQFKDLIAVSVKELDKVAEECKNLKESV